MISLDTRIDFQTMMDYKINFVRDVLGVAPWGVTTHLGKVVTVSREMLHSGPFDDRLAGYPDGIECLVEDGMEGIFAGGGIGWGDGLILSILNGPKKGSIIFARARMIQL